ncbi:zinc-dependent metalloprotease [Galbibacter sp. EGI 63066]|uniref:zinc-dependent metalloprotease n=1 Tax=Galbibacter sp. EGI 63066 TaxID=2993559 RepID=UPI002248A941|nr:zinc-dependent metalloprotease [Galbibacter sp. EGI 63066]MCX2680997.1 zinc-dependent metalloprotease [Galbibacter sp. EGI 63066]
MKILNWTFLFLLVLCTNSYAQDCHTEMDSTGIPGMIMPSGCAVGSAPDDTNHYQVRISFVICQNDSGYKYGFNFNDPQQDFIDLNWGVGQLNDVLDSLHDPSYPVAGVPIERNSGIQFVIDTIIYIKEDSLALINDKATDIPAITGMVPPSVFERSRVIVYTDMAGGGAPGGRYMSPYNVVLMANSHRWIGGLLTHEIGHGYGLRHTFCGGSNKTILCDGDVVFKITDTAPDRGAYCDSLGCSNNIMGYNGGNRVYLSPMQTNMMKQIIKSGYPGHIVGHPTSPGVTYYNQTDTINGLHFSPAKEIVVKSGATLYINGDLSMPGNGLIKVEAGAKIEILCGGISGPVNNRWTGIQLMGDNTKIQIPQFQGSLIMHNDTYIENAIDAVSNCFWDNGPVSSSGGIISTDGAIFQNNLRDIHLIPYSSKPWIVNWLNPTLSPLVSDYKAEFKNTSFIKTSSFINPGNIKRNASVDMAGVYGVKFIGCSWKVDVSIASSISNEEYAKTAILAFDATLKLQMDSISKVRNEIEFYPNGVHINASQPLFGKRNVISHTYFFMTRHSIRINGDIGSIIARNRIRVPKDTSYKVFYYGQEQEYKDFPYGIYLTGAPLTTIEENDFDRTSTEVNIYETSGDATTIGLVFRNCGETVNIPYNNTFTGLDYAVQALGNNRNSSGKSGLQVRCNEFIDCGYDIVVWPEHPHPNQGIRENQGDPASNPGQTKTENLAGNLFTKEPGEPDYANYNNLNVNYHHHDSAATPAVEPAYLGYLTPFEYTEDFIKADACSPHMLILESTGDTLAQYDYPIDEAYADYHQWDNQVDSISNLLDELIDGGNTWQLEAQIYFITNEEHYDLYVDLMNQSPYLSAQILEDVILIEDFPDMMLRNIMVANPGTSREPHILDLLYQHHPGMPSSYIQDIIDGTKTWDAKDVMQAQVGKLISQKEIAGREVMQRIDDVEEQATAVAMLEDVLLNPYVSDYGYFAADYFLTSDQTEEANTIIADLANEMNSLGENMPGRHTNIVSYLNWRNGHREGNYYDTLDMDDQDALWDMVDNGDYSGVWSQSFLEYQASLDNEYNDARFTDYVMVPDLEKSARRRRSSIDEQGKFKLYPNPVDAHTLIEVPGGLIGEKLNLYLYGMDGQLIESRTNKEMPFVYEMEHLQKGAYILQYEYQNEILGQTKLIKL